MQKVAFFDVDGTLFRSSLFTELIDQLVVEGVFPSDTAEVYEAAYKNWLHREGSYEDYLNSVLVAFYKHLKGTYYGDFADVGRRVVAMKSKKVYRYTRDLLEQLKREGYFLIAISQSPKSILDDFCKQYGFDKVYGRVYEIGPQDRFTGAVTDEHLIKNKANIVKRVFDKNPGLTREGSIAVGDTDGDIPLFENVERQICFNPNQALYTQAKRNGWEIVVERKDVIYRL
ncbi:MAG: HAD-IB family phosphatase [Patescibacteria group bacterium]